MIPAELLYSHGLREFKQKVYQHYSQETIFCKQDQIVLNFLTPESKQKLLSQNYSDIHLGLIMIGIHGLHRKHLGTKALISVVDSRHQNLEQAIIGQMEVDLTHNKGLVYLVPDYQLPIEDFANYFQIIVQTKGYESMTFGTANLAITKALVGRIGNQIASNFKLQIDHVLTYLNSKGISAIPGKAFDSSLLGHEWVTRLPQTASSSKHPTSSSHWTHPDESVTTVFSQYKATPQPDSDDDQPTTVLMLQPLDILEIANDFEENPYPTLMADVGSSTNVPPSSSTTTGTPVFRPATQPRQPLATPQEFGYTPTPQFQPRVKPKPLIFDNIPSLPQANIQSGSILQLDTDLAHWEERIRRWESNVITTVAQYQFIDDNEKVSFIENLLGETAKLYFQNWKAQFPDQYANLVNIAGNTMNITTQIRQMLLGYDEYRGYTEMQNQALLDIERLTITNMRDIKVYSNNYLHLASKTGQAFASQELSDKYFRKMPPPFNSKLQEKWTALYPTLTIGIAPRIHFTYQVLQDLCRQNELNRQAKDFSFCREIEVSGSYSKPYRNLRRAKTYKGKHPHANHVRKFKIRKPGNIKCRCYICGQEGHFANQCRSKFTNRERLAVYQSIIKDPEYDIVSLQEGEPDDDSDICSYSEEDDSEQKERQEFCSTMTDEVIFMITTEWNLTRANKRLTETQGLCTHQWQPYPTVKVTETKCYFCNLFPFQHQRVQCQLCHLLLCIWCLQLKFQVSIPAGPSSPLPSLPSSSTPTAPFRSLVQQQAQHIVELEATIQRLEAELQHLSQQLQQSSPSKLKGIQIIEDCLTAPSPQRLSSVTNNLLNLTATLVIDGTSYLVQALFDTGASKCCIDPHALPASCYLPLDTPIIVNGLNSVQQSFRKVKKGEIILNQDRYPLPFTFVTDIKIHDRTQLIIGMNFIHSFKGGCRIEGTTVTFYRKADVIQTTPISRSLLSETANQLQPDILLTEEFSLFHYNLGRLTDYHSEILPILDHLKQLHYIGNNPLEHWTKNSILCHLELLNPDFTIQDKPIVPSPNMVVEYRKHITALLQIKVIQPSHSRHRTAAFVVFSGSDQTPSGEQIKRKSRLVFNYKRLNDNTAKDQYTLPSIDYLLLKIRDKEVYSKFDLKSGFHQVAMHPDSIPWTAFTSPLGHFEWLVMPFGLKNAPAIFQRKMDNIFLQYDSFIVTYIDDILIFSDNIAQHVNHLKIFFNLCQQHGLIISETKFKIGVSQIEFLGLEIGKGIIKLQPHIVKSLLDFDNLQLTTLKGLQRFLGILNYARNYIPNLSKYTAPLYSKCSLHGERRFNSQDWNLIHKIKNIIRNLPALELPPHKSYIIIECDGSLDGWGGILKWRPTKDSPTATEKVSRFTSGTYKVKVSSLDAEILACIYTLEKFKIFIYNITEFTLRTDCNAIVTFYHKLATKKLSIMRWLIFVDYLTQIGTEVHIEHIKGKDNTGADKLSRILSSQPQSING